jgi:flagellar protein FliO/FliZ
MELMDLARAVAALTLTLGLLLGFAWLAKRYGLMQGAAAAKPGGRLRLIEQLWLDAGRTRAVVLRCDGADHLIVITPTGATAIAALATPVAVKDERA